METGGTMLTVCVLVLTVVYGSAKADEFRLTLQAAHDREKVLDYAGGHFPCVTLYDEFNVERVKAGRGRLNRIIQAPGCTFECGGDNVLAGSSVTKILQTNNNVQPRAMLLNSPGADGICMANLDWTFDSLKGGVIGDLWQKCGWHHHNSLSFVARYGKQVKCGWMDGDATNDKGQVLTAKAVLIDLEHFSHSSRASAQESRPCDHVKFFNDFVDFDKKKHASNC